jgi:hypothetical protein
VIRIWLVCSALLLAQAAMAETPRLTAYNEAAIRAVAAKLDVKVKSAGKDAKTHAPFLILTTKGVPRFMARGEGCTGAKKLVCNTITFEAQFPSEKNVDFKGFSEGFNATFKPAVVTEKAGKWLCTYEVAMAGGKTAADVELALKDFLGTASALGKPTRH